MNDMKQLDHLASIADEMLAGLHADESMRLRILHAARAQAQPAKRNAVRRFAPAFAALALAAVCMGAIAPRLGGDAGGAQPMVIGEIAAGKRNVGEPTLMADLGEGASVRMGRSAATGSIFAAGEADIPLIAVNGAVYRLLETPYDVGGSLLGGKVGSVGTHTDQPSLASSDAMRAGLSNVAAESAAIYAVSGLDSGCAVAAQVDGSMRIFQRVSYAGKGPGSASLEDTFSVRGKVKSVELSGVGEISGSAANEVIAVLLDKATLVAADASAKKQFLTVTLNSGLRLQLGVSGDMLCGCGGWSCPEFFEAFEKAL